MAFVSCGLRIGVRVSQPELLEQVVRRLPPISRPSLSPVVSRLYWIRRGGERRRNIRRYHSLFIDSLPFEKSLEMDDLLRIFEDDVEMYVAENARRRLFLHAGVVGWHGRAILLPGKSMSGKSTLVARLVEAGATYYSDEFAVLDSRGLVHPYRKPISLRTDPEAAYRRVSMAGLHYGDSPKPLPVGLIVSTYYAAGRRWRPRTLSPGKGTLELLSNTISARRQPRVAVSMLSKLAGKVPILKGCRGEAVAMVEDLLDSQFVNWK